MLAREGDNYVLAFKYDTPKLSQVVSLKFDMQIQDDGSAKIELNDVRGGRLSLSVKELDRSLINRASQLNENLSLTTDKLRKMIDTFDGLKLDPVIKVNNQNVRITDMILDEKGFLDLALKSAQGR